MNVDQPISFLALRTTPISLLGRWILPVPCFNVYVLFYMITDCLVRPVN